ncbi:uncharacterized protein LOC117180706 [Belonocnema kinseyi]|uniref:uncharacterized protein LOC117180706 n=1 Tax=Belonocnema kinseyi TaxID=2817044 RepID=UPI00143D44E4|nr:uncharacterized protein LOC117180706 [Belonocnema kinseyi]
MLRRPPRVKSKILSTNSSSPASTIPFPWPLGSILRISDFFYPKLLLIPLSLHCERKWNQIVLLFCIMLSEGARGRNSEYGVRCPHQSVAFPILGSGQSADPQLLPLPPRASLRAACLPVPTLAC